MADKILDVEMYSFLAQTIRDQDKQKGNEFIKRFLMGGQEVWELTQQKIYDVKKLWSVTECPDEQLTHLKRIVGWTPDIEKIISGLDYAALRRMISISVPLWKSRTTEQSIVDVLNVLLPSKARVWSWFDLRWVLDETVFTEEHQGRDSWLISIPDGEEEYWSNVRIVDPGVSSRKLLKDVLNLMRPAGERYEIIYLKFLDLFAIVDDWSQWDVFQGSNPSVSGGMLVLDSINAQGVVVNTIDSTTWSSYVVSARMRGLASSGGDGYGIVFYSDLTLASYRAFLSVADNKLYVIRVASGGGETAIANFDFGTVGYTIKNNVWYGLRVQISPEGGTNRIKVYVDGEERISSTDSVISQGTAGVFRDDLVSADCDEFEILGLPVEKDTVEINY